MFHKLSNKNTKLQGKITIPTKILSYLQYLLNIWYLKLLNRSNNFEK